MVRMMKSLLLLRLRSSFEGLFWIMQMNLAWSFGFGKRKINECMIGDCCGFAPIFSCPLLEIARYPYMLYERANCTCSCYNESSFMLLLFQWSSPRDYNRKGMSHKT